MPGISKRSRGWRGHEPFPSSFGSKARAKVALKQKARLLRQAKEKEEKLERGKLARQKKTKIKNTVGRETAIGAALTKAKWKKQKADDK
jgi:hypothetical protein